VATATRCRSVQYERLGRSAVIGFAAPRDAGHRFRGLVFRPRRSRPGDAARPPGGQLPVRL